MENIVTSKDCEACRWCCEFNAEDCWEIPSGTDGKPLFTLDFAKTNEDLPCPHLNENGCTLGENKPLDCKMWPFRKMSGRLAICTDCPAVANASAEQIAQSAATISAEDFAGMSDKSYNENYKVLL